jgi:NAD(P)-dependent dehydrogenase (short-subunit alcohol dehydrogenase family)
LEQEIAKMDATPLVGQIALITGGASGIGEATVGLFVDAGATVAILDRDGVAAKRVVADIEARGGRATAHVVDLLDTGSIPGAVAEILATHGRIDALVNAAGISGDEGEILEQSEENWDRVQAINLKAPFRMIQEVARHMIERGGGGRIVSITSSSAHRARQSMAPYGAAKAGLTQLTRTAAADLGRYDINVNAVAPGVTMTPMTHMIGDEEDFKKVIADGPLANLLNRVSKPEDVADAILYLCLPGSRQITGQTIHTSAGAVI